MQDRPLTAETVEDVSVDSRQEAEFDKVGVAIQAYFAHNACL
jgi:hypothetical protein